MFHKLKLSVIKHTVKKFVLNVTQSTCSKWSIQIFMLI